MTPSPPPNTAAMQRDGHAPAASGHLPLRAILLAVIALVGAGGCAAFVQSYGALTLAEPDGGIVRRYVSGTEMLRSQGAHSEVHMHLPRVVHNDRPLRLTVMVLNTGELPLEVDIESASATWGGRDHEVYTLREWAHRVRSEQAWAAFFGGLTAIALVVGGFAIDEGHHHGSRGRRHSYGYAPALGLSLAYWDLVETDTTLRALDRQWRTASKTFLQRHTLAPGTWYGGAVLLDPVLPLWGGEQRLEFRIRIGGDEHRFPLQVSAR